MAGMSSGGGMSASGGAAGPSNATGGHTSTGFNVGDYYGGNQKQTQTMLLGTLAVVGVLGVVWIIAGQPGGRRRRKK